MMRLAVALLALVVSAQAYHFNFDEGWEEQWKHSADKKYSGNTLHVESPPGLSMPALKVPEKARHYGLSAMLPQPVDPAKNLVLQYEVKLPPNGLTCGGAYLKFLTASPELVKNGLESETPYTVMFGPDKCGPTNKVHLILKHENQKTGDVEEKHLRSPPSFPNDDRTHVFTVELDAEANTYRVLVDWEEKRAGKLSEDFDPAFDPPAMISDPEDVKPEDWVDAPEIADPTASKPDDWDEDAPSKVEDMEVSMPEGWLEDEPAEVDDPDARRPDDWDEEEDGDWEPPTMRNPRCVDAPGCGPWKRPLVPNPAHMGPWTAPMIANPAYKGLWSPREIANPAHFVDERPLAHIGKVGAVALEIWTMDNEYYFDNVVVSNNFGEAAALKSVWEVKFAAEEEEAQKRLKKLEAERKQADEEGEDEDDEPTWAETVVDAVFDHPLLEPYADVLAPARKFFESRPVALPALFGTIVALLLGVLMSGLRGKGAQRRRPSAVPQPRAAAAKAPARSASPQKKAKKPEPEPEPETNGEEIQTGSEEESDSDKAAAPAPRRPRRD